MTKKHYVLIAAVINARLKREYEIQRAGNEVRAAIITLQVLANDLARAFAQDNARFDAERFINACNPE